MGSLRMLVVFICLLPFWKFKIPDRQYWLPLFCFSIAMGFLANVFMYKVDKSFIVFNGHLAEFGYYFYGVDGLRRYCEDKGCTPKLYNKLKIGPITFQTTESFKKEVRENSIIIVNPRIMSISEDCKKWSSQSDILNENQELCASIASNGAFMDHSSRKVASPPQVIQEKWRLLLEVN